MARSSELTDPEVSDSPLSALPNLIVFYDGDCSFCHGAAGWLLEHDPRARLHYAPLQGDTARRLRFEFGGQFPDEIDTIVLYDARDGRPGLRIRSEAIFEVLRTIGGPWRCLALLRVLPRILTDTGYDLIANWRLHLRREPPACQILDTARTSRLLP